MNDNDLISPTPYTRIYCIYAEYILPQEREAVWTGTLIQALETQGLSESAVRSALQRMRDDGYALSRRQGRRSTYRLTRKGLSEIRWGRERALAKQDGEWNGQWTVLIYSIPEAHRDRRDALRWMLHMWGFGSIAPGTWVSPLPLAAKHERDLEELGVWEYVTIFRAEHLGSQDPKEMTAQAWPKLEEVGDSYQHFLATYQRAMTAFRGGGLDDEAIFTAHLGALCQFVAITLDDPALPDAILPSYCPRDAAQRTFETLQDELRKPAHQYFDTLCDHP